MSKHMVNKVVLITGSREGIGFQTSLQLASRNWTILMADKHDLEDAKNKIVSMTSNKNIFTFYLDLGCFKSVRSFTDAIKQTQNRLDVLVNNAGIFESNEKLTIDNLKPVMQINYLGPFLLTILLIDLLKMSSPSRIIFLSSSGAFLHSLNSNTLPILDKDHYFPSFLGTYVTYSNSKLCNMIMCKEMAERLKKYNITSNCLHPGMTNTGILLKGDSLKYLNPMAHKLIQLMTQNPKQSAEMTTFLTTSKTLSQVTGQYFVDYNVSQMPKIVQDQEYRKKVWRQAEDIVGLAQGEKLI